MMSELIRLQRNHLILRLGKAETRNEQIGRLKSSALRRLKNICPELPGQADKCHPLRYSLNEGCLDLPLSEHSKDP